MSEAKQEVDTVRMWEIARFVEAHPDNHEQRWRLAKKLYASWEYRLALEHLQVLKEEWSRKVNVVRYLAAAYYRLGRYAEAEQELREGLIDWPQDLGLREQLARVLETDGRREEAAVIWEEIRGMQPAHAMADSAVRRLRQPASRSAQEDLHIAESDSGIDLSPGQICPNCGAQNGDDFDRCWHCHASLFGGSSTRRSTPSIRTRGERVLGMAPETVRLVGGLTLVGLLTVCLYLSLRLVLQWHHTQSEPVVRSLVDLYQQQLGLSRVLAGGAMILLAPLLLTGAVMLVRPKHAVSGSLMTLAALISASLLFLSTWPGLYVFMGASAGLALLLAGVLWSGLRLDLLRAVGSALLTMIFFLFVSGTTFAASEYFQTKALFNPVTDVPALWRYAQIQNRDKTPGEVQLASSVTPLEIKGVVWDSSGSRWLNRRAGLTQFTLTTQAATPGFKFEIEDSRTTRLYEPVTSAHFQCVFLVEPGESYTLRTALAAPGIPVSVSAAGFLTPRLPQAMPVR